ncbi:MAG: hypothetical protein U0610_33265 [bacterium]
MNTDELLFVASIYREDGTPLGSGPLDVDLDPAFESTWFSAFRAGELDAAVPASAARIEPLWHPSAGAPYLEGFRVVVVAPGGAAIERRFPTSYFEDATRAVAEVLVRDGKLAAGDRYRFFVSAFPRERAHPSGEGEGEAVVVSESPPSLSLVPGRLATFTADAAHVGEGTDGDMPVIVPDRIRAECEELTRRNHGQETGGILIGALRRDCETRQVFADVTAQIPARHTLATATRLTFQPETWTDVRAAIALRGGNEMMVGWWHSHVVYAWGCKDCPPERQRDCSLARGFLSEHDVALHRTVFPRAWNVALVVTHTAADELRHALFGWRLGRMAKRGFFAAPSP